MEKIEVKSVTLKIKCDQIWTTYTESENKDVVKFFSQVQESKSKNVRFYRDGELVMTGYLMRR